MQTTGISIRGVSASLPNSREDNLEYEHLSVAQRQKLVDTTGIRYRWLATNETVGSMCHRAAKTLLEQLNWKSRDIQLLILVTQTPDMPIPGTASQLHAKLGLNKNCIVLDINQGCAGYVYGLSVAMSLMQSFKLSKGLLLTGDTITKYVSPHNQSLRPIFSDAATATALCSKKDSSVQFGFGVNGDRFKTIHLPELKHSSELSMNGLDVFNYGLTEVVDGVNSMLESMPSKPTIDHLVMHQANKLLNDSIARKVGISPNKVPFSLYDFGNTSSSTIPLTLASQLGTEHFNEQRTVLLLGFGVGLTWAASLLDLKDVICVPVESW